MESYVVAGLVAGIISGIVATIALISACVLNLPWPNLPVSSVLTTPFLTTHLEFEFVINGFFGIIFGIIYSKYYDATPGKGIIKGLCFGLILYLIGGFYPGVHIWERYMDIVSAIGTWWMVFFCLTSYGLVLGALYRRPTRAVGKHDVKSGVFSGTVAGVIGGIAATIFMIIGVNLKVWAPFVPGILSATSFTAHHILEIIVTIAFGAIFGAMYSIYYDSTPGKGILKGLVYGLLLYLISSIRTGVLFAGYGNLSYAISVFWLGFFTLAVYGLVLGALYRK